MPLTDTLLIVEDDFALGIILPLQFEAIGFEVKTLANCKDTKTLANIAKEARHKGGPVLRSWQLNKEVEARMTAFFTPTPGGGLSLLPISRQTTCSFPFLGYTFLGINP